jgi:acyl-CoA synthetase (AMP-forming)/AMP-acid ligase II
MADAATIPDLLNRRRQEDPELDAIVSDDDSLSYLALDDRSASLAARLAAGGVQKGSRIGLIMPNGLDWAITGLAVMRLGATLVPLSTLLRPPELLAQLRVSSVTHLITVTNHRGHHYLEDLEEVAPGVTGQRRGRVHHPALPGLRHLWAPDDIPRSSVEPSLFAALESAVKPSDDMAIMFTSGSRGRPKGVIHTHGNALRAVASGLEARRVGHGERLYIPMPFFWMGGFGAGLLTTLVAGATLLTESTPEPAATIRFLERQRVTLFRGWPDQAARIAADPTFVAADLSSLRAGSLAAVLPPDRRPRPGARANLFGMTESFGPYCGARLDVDLPTSAFGSCGRPFDGIEVRIVAPDTGLACGPGEKGEILLRGTNMMRGICGRSCSEVLTPDTYYPTGDLGYLDTDGYLFYVGRADDMFKVKGATVYPSEVEVALRSIDGVRLAFVTDVPGPDGARQVGAAVFLSEGSEPDLAREARRRLSSFKVPTVWSVLTATGDVPMSATGKVDKTGLQRLLHEAME